MQSRRMVLIVGQLLLVASQLLLMEARAYWMMIIGRLLEGFASSVVIVAGFALMYVSHLPSLHLCVHGLTIDI